MKQREKRAYIAYLVYLLRSRMDNYMPVQFATEQDFENEIRQVEAHIIALSKKCSNSNVEFQLN